MRGGGRGRGVVVSSRGQWHQVGINHVTDGDPNHNAPLPLPSRTTPSTRPAAPARPAAGEGRGRGRGRMALGALPSDDDADRDLSLHSRRVDTMLRDQTQAQGVLAHVQQQPGSSSAMRSRS